MMAFGKIGNKLGSFFDMSDDEDEEYAAQEDQEFTQPADGNEAPAAAQGAPSSKPAYRNNSNVVSMSKPAAKGAKIELYEPRIYSDAKEVGRNLLDNTAVLVNFTHLEASDAKRIVDFLTGLVFAINGDIKRVGDQIFLVTPANFEVSGALANKIQDDLSVDELK
jgi:cell division inhibitor SepF